MKSSKALLGILAAGLTAGAVAGATEGQSPFSVENSLRLGYDDNVTHADEDKVSSMYIREQVSLSFTRTYENGLFRLRYDPSLTWYEDLGEDSDMDWTHGVSLSWAHQMSRRFSLAVEDTFLYTDRSEVVDADGTLRQANYSYAYNSASIALTAMLTPKYRLTATGRNQFMSYESDFIGHRDNYEIWAGGLSLGAQMGKKTIVYLDGAYEDMSYDGAGRVQEVFVPGFADSVVFEVPDRGTQTSTIGLGAEATLGPKVMGRARIGYMHKEFEAANTDSDDSPYGELSVVIAPVSTTRLTLGAGYSLYQSGLATYSSQERTTISANLAQDVTAKIVVSLIGQYYMSDYSADASVALVGPDRVEDGTETAFTLGARVSYQINRSNFVDAGYAFTKFDSDYTGRPDVERNRVDLGWRIRM